MMRICLVITQGVNDPRSGVIRGCRIVYSLVIRILVLLDPQVALVSFWKRVPRAGLQHGPNACLRQLGACWFYSL